MKRMYKMNDEEFRELSEAAEDPATAQEQSNLVWKRLAKKYGFVWNSFSPASPEHEQTYFMASPNAEGESREEKRSWWMDRD